MVFSVLTRIGLEDARELVGDEVWNDRIPIQPEYSGKMMSNQSQDLGKLSINLA